jgi:hypothetical protein
LSRVAAGLGALLCLAGCSSNGPNYTLYRDSATARAYGQTLRVHWATFNAAESGDYNRGNCEMAAGLLNENIQRLNEGEAEVSRFWCEEGRFHA